MVEEYRELATDSMGDRALPFSLYGLEGEHKHLAEMSRFSLVRHPPLFNPSVAHTYCGMLVSTPLTPDQFARPVDCGDIVEIWRDYYQDSPFVAPVSPADAALRDGKFLDIDGCNLTNRVELYAFGNQEAGITLIGRLDNLGKGASGNAVQCLNLMLGRDEQTGLRT